MLRILNLFLALLPHLETKLRLHLEQGAKNKSKT